MDVGIEVFPYNLLVWRDLKDSGLLRIALTIAANHCVAVRKALSSTRIRENARSNTIVCSPNDLATGVEFYCLVSIGKIDQHVPVLEWDRREWPVFLKTEKI